MANTNPEPESKTRITTKDIIPKLDAIILLNEQITLDNKTLKDQNNELMAKNVMLLQKNREVRHIYD